MRGVLVVWLVSTMDWFWGEFEMRHRLRSQLSKCTVITPNECHGRNIRFMVKEERERSGKSER